ncbi:MAG: TolC family protein [Nitrospirae bacterium]|nr:TolC family protein [Nitrospirota bacterium]
MKKAIIFLFFFLNVVPYCAYADEYSLEDLYRLALEKSETIKIAEEDLYISERQKDKAKAVLMPTLSAFGNHTRYNESKSSDTTLIQPDYTNDWGVRLDQSMSLSGRELTAFKIAKEGIEKSREDLDAVKEEYLLTVASSYYDLLKAKKAREIAGANVERLTKHRDAAATRLKVGEVTKTVLLRAEAELAGSQSELIRSENSLRLAKSILARTVGITWAFEVKGPEFDKDMETREQELLDTLIGDCRLATLECLSQKAFSERAEVKTVTIQRQIAEDQVKYTKGSYWPDVSVEGVYHRQENSPSTAFGLDERIYGALKLNFPFFEGGLRVAEVREANAKLRQADHRLADLKYTVGVEVENAYLNLLTVSAVIDKLQAEAEYAADNYNSVTKQFQYGLADSIDVIDANTLLVTSERELANAGYDYELAILNLKRAAGTLLKSVTGDQATY